MSPLARAVKKHGVGAACRASHGGPGRTARRSRQTASPASPRVIRWPALGRRADDHVADALERGLLWRQTVEAVVDRGRTGILLKPSNHANGLRADAVARHPSYGMPAFLHAGRPPLGFRAARQRLSVFPFSPASIEALKDRLDGFDLAKGTIRFSPERPPPEDVLADLVRPRRQEISP